jgi:hypothetical protein
MHAMKVIHDQILQIKWKATGARAGMEETAQRSVVQPVDVDNQRTNDMRRGGGKKGTATCEHPLINQLFHRLKKP